jgi:hypothetical protein
MSSSGPATRSAEWLPAGSSHSQYREPTVIGRPAGRAGQPRQANPMQRPGAPAEQVQPPGRDVGEFSIPGQRGRAAQPSVACRLQARRSMTGLTCRGCAGDGTQEGRRRSPPSHGSTTAPAGLLTAPTTRTQDLLSHIVAAQGYGPRQLPCSPTAANPARHRTALDAHPTGGRTATVPESLRQSTATTPQSLRRSDRYDRTIPAAVDPYGPTIPECGRTAPARIRWGTESIRWCTPGRLGWSTGRSPGSAVRLSISGPA